MEALYRGRKVPKGTDRYTAVPPPQGDNVNVTWTINVMQRLEKEEVKDSPNDKLYMAHPSYRKWCEDRDIKRVSR